MSVENLETYINRNGYGIIRRCSNCKFWSGDITGANNQKPMGYCKMLSMYFAYTLENTVYPITKDFYLCEKHEFENEEVLKDNSEKILLKEVVKKKTQE